MYIKKILLAIVFIGLVVVAYFAYFVYSAMFKDNTAFNNEKVYVYITTNSTYQEVRTQLIPLLNNISTFDKLAERKKYPSNIKAGRFVIERDMNNNDIINSIRSNNIPIRVSFNNQETLERLAGRIASQIESDSISLLAVMKEGTFLSENNFENNTALGMYIPNSYEFFWNTSAEQFRERMLREYNLFWNDPRTNKAKTIGLTPNEVITLASIVHEESKKINEQARIAGVYINRIKIGMPLQADPTIKFVAYTLPKYHNTVIRRVLNEHKEIDSPYNTYKYAGLPPGLIAMPDVSSIDAVLNYESHNYYYFAADAKRLGYHKFAGSLSQHNVNAREYQRYLSLQGINK